MLSWDQQVNMPPGGAEIRANQMATLGRITHDREISPALGRLLDALQPYAETLDPDSDDARLIRVAARDFEKATRVPSEFVAEFNQTTALAFQAWVEARQKSNFAIFRPSPGKARRDDPPLHRLLPAGGSSVRRPAR